MGGRQEPLNPMVPSGAVSTLHPRTTNTLGHRGPYRVRHHHFPHLDRLDLLDEHRSARQYHRTREPEDDDADRGYPLIVIEGRADHQWDGPVGTSLVALIVRVSSNDAWPPHRVLLGRSDAREHLRRASPHPHLHRWRNDEILQPVRVAIVTAFGRDQHEVRPDDQRHQEHGRVWSSAATTDRGEFDHVKSVRARADAPTAHAHQHPMNAVEDTESRIDDSRRGSHGPTLAMSLLTCAVPTRPRRSTTGRCSAPHEAKSSGWARTATATAEVDRRHQGSPA